DGAGRRRGRPAIDLAGPRARPAVGNGAAVDAERTGDRGHHGRGGDGQGGPRAMTRLFGTDGIRGVANEEPLTPDLVFRLGRQLAATLQAEHGAKRARLVIGRDTRHSGPLLESALVAGLLS